MKPLNKTGDMLKALLRRDWIKLIIWIIGMLAFAASGAGKMEVAVSGKAAQQSMYTMFVQNPAMVGLFGPTPIESWQKYSIGPVYGQTMTLITGITFAIVAIIYVINRTRKEENDGVAELFGSFQIGKLANTTAVIIEMLVLHMIIALILAFSIQAQGVPGLDSLESNLLFAFSAASQGFMWGMIALFFAQIFPDAGGAKGATFGLLGILYVVRMGTDTQAVEAGWFNPLSWGNLGFPFALGYESWLGVALAVVAALVMIVLAYLLEVKRDINAGYISEGHGRAHAPKTLLSIPGLVLRQQRGMIIGWFIGLFVIGITYGSMFSQMDEFINSNATVRQLFTAAAGDSPSHNVLVASFMITLFSILSILTSVFAVLMMARMTSEERKNRQEQLYALPVSRLKMYLTYAISAIVLSAVGQFLTLFGVYIVQSQGKTSMSFGEIAGPGMIYLVAIAFVLGLLCLLIAFLPRFTGVIYAYIAFLLFMSYLGGMLDLPDWLMKLSVYDYIPKIPLKAMEWPPVVGISSLAIVLIVIGFVGYRRRDLIGG
ncbi:MAG: ABC transporter permease [Streptococcaceae bacterium]|jgi:ABC-2 type transport system permease protein|nr:ABC transporter permease [Streptococcaceae bacterium]